MGTFLGVAKISNIFWGCLIFLIFLGMKGRCWARAYVWRKIESTPPPPGVDMLQLFGHLLGKGWPPGSLVCDVFLCFCHFPIWCPGSGVVFDGLDSWSLPSPYFNLMHTYAKFNQNIPCGLRVMSIFTDCTLVNVYVDLVVFTRIAGTS